MIVGLDTDTPVSAEVAFAAYDKGARFVCRYTKNLTPGEIQALSTAGLMIVSIFESTALRALGGAAAAYADARKARLQMEALGQPVGSGLYATADFDVTPAQEPDVLTYFTAFKSALDGHAKLGVYANGAICQLVLDKGIADYTWLAGGMGMRGSREFLAAGKATIVQDVGDAQHFRLGIDIDTDRAMAEDYGQWSLREAA